jgi:hypothetical protein
MAVVLLGAHEVVAEQRACLLSRSVATTVCWLHDSAFEQTCHINLEETIILDPMTTKFIGVKGKVCSRFIAASEHDSVTVLRTVTLPGGKSPPLSMFKGT